MDYFGGTGIDIISGKEGIDKFTKIVEISLDMLSRISDLNNRHAAPLFVMIVSQVRIMEISHDYIKSKKRYSQPIADKKSEQMAKILKQCRQISKKSE